jgi:hypothetical protein
MNQALDHPEDAVSAVRQWLLTHNDGQLTEDELHRLVYTIVIYVRRSKRPLADAVPRICKHFLEHGQFVHQLLADPASQDWQVVLTQVISYATAHPYFPAPEQASDWPDLDAYDDIRRKLPSYNFEGPLDRWINVTVVRRLTRFWRDQQAIKVGGAGFQRGKRSDDGPAPLRVRHIPLDEPLNEGLTLGERLEAAGPAVDNQIEMEELERMVSQAVELYAANKHDPELAALWRMIVDQEYKLREVAETFDLTIGQTYHRYLQLRDHLRADPQISSWFDTSE